MMTVMIPADQGWLPDFIVGLIVTGWGIFHLITALDLW